MSSVLRITKKFDLETAHILHGYDGKCKNIHGHSYKLYVTVIGTPIPDSEESPKKGMVIDFQTLKSIVKQKIIDIFDHALVLNKKTPHATMGRVLTNSYNQKIIAVDYQPTCENLVIDFAQRIQCEFVNSKVKLFAIKLYETENSYCEWFANENN